MLLPMSVLGRFLGAALAGGIVGLVMAVANRDTGDDDPEREVRLLSHRLRHPWRSRITPRWLR